jgi:hypothetical protein
MDGGGLVKVPWSNKTLNNGDLFMGSFFQSLPLP